MKKNKFFVLLILPFILSGQKKKVEELSAYAFNKKDEPFRGNFIESLINKKVFYYNKDGQVKKQLNYTSKDSLIGTVFYKVKKKKIIKRTYIKNIVKNEKTIWESDYNYYPNGKLHSKTYYWNKINRGDSIVNYYDNSEKIVERRFFDENNKVKKRLEFEYFNEKLIKEVEFKKDTIESGFTKMEYDGNILLKKTKKNYRNTIFETLYKDNKRTKTLVDGKNKYTYSQEYDSHGKLVKEVTYDKNGKRINMLISRIKYY